MMTTIDRQPLFLEPPIRRPDATRASRRRLSRWTLPLAAMAILAVGITIGSAGAVLATAAPGSFGRYIPRGMLIQHIVMAALDRAGATSMQEARISDIITSYIDDLSGDKVTDAERGREALALLRAPVIDRDAVERLRAETVAAFEARSRLLTTSVLDAASALTAEQRARFAEHIEGLAQHSARGGPFLAAVYEDQTPGDQD